METLEKMSIENYVTQDFRIATLFSKYKIDFCCNGSMSLDEVCKNKGLSVDNIKNEIDVIFTSNSISEIDYKSFTPDLLIDYILDNHHVYVEENVPILFLHLEKLCKGHGENHPELFVINNLLKISGGELLNHLKK